MTHTPGPWSISTDGEATGVIYALRGFEWDDICVITPRCEAAANAHLIAAAPDMFRALEAVSGESEESDYLTQAQIQVMCRSAIRKARGEE